MLRKKATMLDIVKPYETKAPEDFVDNKLSEMEDYILNSEIDNEYLVRVGLWFRKMFYFIIPSKKGGKATGVPLKSREKLVPLFDALNERFGQGQVPPQTSRFVLARTKNERWLSKAIFGSTKYSLWHSKDSIIKEIMAGQTPFAQKVQMFRNLSTNLENMRYEWDYASDVMGRVEYCKIAKIFNKMPLFYSLRTEKFCDLTNDWVRKELPGAKWLILLESLIKNQYLEIPEELWKPYENEIKSYAWGFRSWTTRKIDGASNQPSMENLQFLAVQLGSDGANNQGDAFFFHYDTDPENYIMSANDFLYKYMDAFKEYEANLTEEEKASGMSSLNPNSYFPFDFNEVLLNIPNLNFKIKRVVMRESWYDIYIE